MLDVDTRGGTDEGNGIAPNGLVDVMPSWALLFNDTTWSASQPMLGQAQGAIEIISGGDDFCCGAASMMPSSDLLLISAPLVPQAPYGVISHPGMQFPGEGDKLCKLLQKCSLEELHNVAIGDSICDIENCSWKQVSGALGGDYCTYDGVMCDSHDNAAQLSRTNRVRSLQS